MRIALLNLQYDNNYGGNLQRYALMTILQRMGHDVTHLNLRFNYNPDPLHKHPVRFLKKIIKKIFINHSLDIFREYKLQKKYYISCRITDMFYNKYIKHTAIIDSIEKLKKYNNYDIFLVGSDQVWRKSIAAVYGIDTFFFNYLSDSINAKRIAYGASFGTDENELNTDDLKRLTSLYNRFSAVSVRENSSLRLLSEYGWNTPEAKWVLDPTLLLEKDDYLKIIKEGETTPSNGNMFCYILDVTNEKLNLINNIAKQKNLIPFKIGINGQESIEQWLRSFMDAEYVVTDSYHGIVFSIIFNKPFYLIRNKFRGNARFDAIFKACGLTSDDGKQIDWKEINLNLNKMKLFSKEWLKQSLKLTKN